MHAHTGIPEGLNVVTVFDNLVIILMGQGREVVHRSYLVYWRECFTQSHIIKPLQPATTFLEEMIYIESIDKKRCLDRNVRRHCVSSISI